MLRVMLVDDEALARQGLRAGLEDVPGIEVCGEAANMTQALQAIPALAPDALFLDIRMPRGDGFELLKQLPTHPPVVFVTAHSEYAVQAFGIEAVDYLLKSLLRFVSQERFNLRNGRWQPGKIETHATQPFFAGGFFCRNHSLESESFFDKLIQLVSRPG